MDTQLQATLVAIDQYIAKNGTAYRTNDAQLISRIQQLTHLGFVDVKIAPVLVGRNRQEAPDAAIVLRLTPSGRAEIGV